MPLLEPLRWQRKNQAMLGDPELTMPLAFAPANALERRGRALAIWGRVPRPAILGPVRSMFERAGTEGADLDDIAAITAAMLEAKVNFGGDKRSGYVGVLIDLLEFECSIAPFSREALAAAVYRTITTKVFTPEVAEFLVLIDESRRSFQRTVEIIDVLMANREVAADLLHFTGDISANEYQGDPDEIPF